MPSFLINLASVVGLGMALADMVLLAPDMPAHIRELAEKYANEAEAALGQVKVGG